MPKTLAAAQAHGPGGAGGGARGRGDSEKELRVAAFLCHDCRRAAERVGGVGRGGGVGVLVLEIESALMASVVKNGVCV